MNSLWTVASLGIALAFLCGSIPFGFLIGKINRVDLRRQGSGNIGATNVWRVLGWKWGLPAFILDFLKGFIPLVILGGFLNDTPVGPAQGILVAAALAAILGHNFTPWLGFQGGKGIATSAGVLAALLPASLGVIAAVWIVLFALFRIVSIASLAAAIALPVATWFLYPGQPVFFGFALAAALLTIVRHRANIGRICRGEEKRIGGKK